MTAFDPSPMLNAYPDSMGGKLSDIVEILEKPALAGVFASFYILPSMFNSDLDRGFSVIDYGMNEELASRGDLDALSAQGIDLKLDFVLNHASVQSNEFRDILEKGDASEYRDYFIDWNKFWDGCGEITEKGYIQPRPEYLRDMFFRKPGLPILSVGFPDGRQVPYWNTFYQEIRRTDSGEITYLGQMDLNINSPLVWRHYENTLKTLSEYGAKIVRLDAFAYTSKKPGKKNFLNEPETSSILEKVREIADAYGLTLLPEIHATYAENTYAVLAEKGYLTYDFFLPGLIIDAMERSDGAYLKRWADELIEKNIRTVNMLGCHDGIPLLDLKGLLPDEYIENLIQTVVSRGGLVKALSGQKNMYYQVNATYYSALGEDDGRLLLARAIQLFMPGKPQIWYLDLFAGKNDYEAVKRAGEGGHKEINRTNLSREELDRALEKPVVKSQLELLKFYNSFPAFQDGAKCEVSATGSRFTMERGRDGYCARLAADLLTGGFSVIGTNPGGEVVFHREHLGVNEQE